MKFNKNLKFKIKNYFSPLTSHFLLPKGFTLVELLIVVAIIGILATLFMANYQSVKQRSRDARRKSDLRAILQSGLEMYRADKDSYPSSVSLNCPTTSSTFFGNAPTCDKTYIKVIPQDPRGSAYYNSGNYFYLLNGSSYTLAACLENYKDSEGTAVSPGGSGCTTLDGTNGYYFVLTSP